MKNSLFVFEAHMGRALFRFVLFVLCHVDILTFITVFRGDPFPELFKGASSGDLRPGSTPQFRRGDHGLISGGPEDLDRLKAGARRRGDPPAIDPAAHCSTSWTTSHILSSMAK